MERPVTYLHYSKVNLFDPFYTRPQILIENDNTHPLWCYVLNEPNLFHFHPYPFYFTHIHSTHTHLTSPKNRKNLIVNFDHKSKKFLKISLILWSFNCLIEVWLLHLEKVGGYDQVVHHSSGRKLVALGFGQGFIVLLSPLC